MSSKCRLIHKSSRQTNTNKQTHTEKSGSGSNVSPNLCSPCLICQGGQLGTHARTEEVWGTHSFQQSLHELASNCKNHTPRPGFLDSLIDGRDLGIDFARLLEPCLLRRPLRAPTQRPHNYFNAFLYVVIARRCLKLKAPTGTLKSEYGDGVYCMKPKIRVWSRDNAGYAKARGKWKPWY